MSDETISFAHLTNDMWVDLAESLMQEIPEEDRHLIGGTLLDVVNASFEPHNRKARQWLQRSTAQVMFLSLNLSYQAVLEQLHKKWRKIDMDAPAPGQVLH